MDAQVIGALTGVLQVGLQLQSLRLETISERMDDRR